MSSERVDESSLVVAWITFMGYFFHIFLTNNSDLLGSESIFGISQDPPMCVYISPSQDGFHQRGLWVVSSIDITPLFNPKEPFCSCVVRKIFRLWEWEICGLLSSIWAGPRLLPQFSCYSYLGVLFHRGQISQCFTLGRHLPPASKVLIQ